MKNRLWISPNNDLEAKTIIKLLQKGNEEFLITEQKFGASWNNLEEEIKTKIKEAKEQKKSIYGIELQGNLEGVINIDHHKYGEEDRTNPKSALEQVADILGVELSLDEKFISENDKAYIPAMEKLGKELGIGEEDLHEIIANVRMREREAQGITMEQEAQAEEAIRKVGDLSDKRDYVEIEVPHSKNAPIQDRLYGIVENLLILCGDGETDFHGSAKIIDMLDEKFPGGWSGGPKDKGYGFWGGYVDQEAVKKEVQNMIDKMRAEKNKEYSEKSNIR